MIYSEEQIDILSEFNNNKHIQTIACAGAGKTASIKMLAKDNPDLSFMAVTYSRSLSDETKEKLIEDDINNVEMQTYHGFCTKYFGAAHNDATFSRHLLASPTTKAAVRLKTFDILIIDEIQDMNQLYYQFIKNKLQYFKPELQMVLLGDGRQTIYQFNGGNSKYLCNAEEFWERPFKRCSLSTTYRMTHNIVNVVNTLIASKYPEPFYMKAIDKPKNPPVEYHFVNLFGGGKSIIMKAIKEYGLNNVLLMSVSVKEKTPMNRVLNDLSAAGVNMCVLKDNDGPIDREVLKNKLVASTIHKQKGSERQCVILYGFDCSYHKYYGQDKSLEEYLNLIYVAFTRAKEKLIIIGDRNHGYPKNWQPNEVNQLIKKGSLMIFGKPGNKCTCSMESKCICNERPYKTVFVTDLIKYRSFSCLDGIVNNQHIQKTEHDRGEIELTSDKTASMNNGLVEHVSTIYGVLIPIIVEYFYHKKIKTVDFILSEEFILYFKDMQPQLLKHLDKNKRYEMFMVYEKIKKSNLTNLDELIDQFYEEFAKLSLCVLCYDNYVYPLHQIDNFNWIDISYIKECAQRLVNFKEELLQTYTQQTIMPHNDETRIDHKVDMKCIHPTQVPVKFTIYGRIDDMIGDVIIEYKISSNFGDNSHVAQILNYMWIKKKSIGYLYYPNLDKYIKIQVKDPDNYDKHCTNWLDKLAIEYYHLTLKKNQLIFPTNQTNMSSIKSLLLKHNINHLDKGNDDEEDEELILPKQRCQL